MKILVVEDDDLVVETLQVLLSSYGYAVDVATDGDAGLQMANAFDYDLFLLDVVLPKGDGITLCQQLRQNGCQVPILLLTGQGEVRQKAIALNAGADDYVVKPFDPEELVARVQALLRRGGQTVQSVLQWGPLSLDPSSHKVVYGMHLLSISPKEYAILELFLRNPQKPLSAATILDHAWTSLESPGEEAVRVHIKELRRKLREVGAAKDFIETKYRLGYQLNSRYSNLLAAQVEQQPTTHNVVQLAVINEELRQTLEGLQVAQEELMQQNEQLQMMQQELELERRRYRNLFDYAPNAYLVTDLRGVIQKANHAASVLLQIEGSQLVGKPLAIFVATDNRSTFWHRLKHFTFPQDWEFSLQPRGNIPFPVLVSVTINKNLQHEPIDLCWALHDIRARQAMEQQLQAAHDEMQLQVVERTANLAESNEALRQQQNQWKALFDHALDAIAICDDEGHYLDANPAACTLFGMSREELLQTCIADFADPSLDLAPIWQQFLDQGQLFGEFCVHRPDGTKRETEFNAIAHFIPGRHLSIMRDVSDRKHIETERNRIEATLRERDRQLSKIVNSLPGYLYQVQNDPNYTPQFISQGVTKVTGYTQDDYLVHHTVSCGQEIVPEDAAAVWAVVQQAVESHQPYECEYRILAQDGAEKWVWEYGQGIYTPDGSLSYLEGFVMDITRRKQMELSLQQSEAQFRHFAENSRAVIWLAQPGPLNTSYVSPAYEQIWGRPVESFADQPDAWLPAIHPKDRDYVQAQYTQQPPPERLELEYRIVRPDGSIRWIWDRAFVIRNDEGQVYGYGGFAEDITERKQLELSLRDSEAKLSQVINSAIAAIASFRIFSNHDWAYDYFSAGCEIVFGYTAQELMADQQLWWSRVWPDDREAILMPLIAELLTERTVTAEFRFYHKDGSIRWISSIHTSHRIDDDCWRITVVNSDISDRKQAEIALQQQIRQEYLLADMAQSIRCSLKLDEVLSSTVHRVRAFLNCDRVLLFRFRPDWQGDVITESVGPEWLSIFSTTIFDPCFEERYIAPYRQGHISTLSDVDTENLEPCYAELLKSFQVKASLAVPVLQGETLWGLLIAHQCSAPRQWQPVEIALLRRLSTQVGIAIQQSELYEQTRHELLTRERIQTILEESEARFRTISAAAPIGILQTNADGICLYTNDSWQEMAGMTFENSLGYGWLQAIHPGDRPSFQQAWDAYLQGSQKTLPEVRLQGSEGIRWIVARSAPIHSTTNEVLGHVCVCTDITEQKQLEAQFYQAQRLESLGQLASGIAHDLNNVLTPILAMAYVLRLQQTSLDIKAQEQLRLIEASAKRGASMVKQVLTLTRGSNGEKAIVNVATVLDDIIQILQESWPNSIEICPHLPNPNHPDKALSPVFADSTQLAQIFMNLCVNARDAMPDGGKLTIAADNVFVDAAIAQANLDAQIGNYVRVTIADTGIGIDPALRDRIFDPFFTTKEPGKGTGLGLPMVLRIVKNHGGFLHIMSAANKGTQVEVYLPVPEASLIEETKAARSQKRQWSGSGELVLIVDDDFAVQQTTQALLESRDYSTLIANDGIEAIALYQQHQAQIRLVLLDITMPKMSGIELIRRLKDINPDVPMIASSGLWENQESSLEAGASAFLAKPYTLETFLELVYQWVNQGSPHPAPPDSPP